MRNVASYALESAQGSGSRDFDDVMSAITRWLIEKGWSEGSKEDFTNSQGCLTRVAKVSLAPPQGRLERYLIAEKLPEAIFATEISVAHEDERCALYVELKIEGVGPRLQPFRFDARRPKFIGQLLHGDLRWCLGDTPLTDEPYDFQGKEGGRRAVEILWHPERAVPVVMVSLINGSGITSNFVTKLAGDLAGLAIVATSDEEASWAITREKGAEWSCFNGALRLYWPITPNSLQPRLHPLWFRTTMLASDTDPSNASYKMRAQIRRIILGVSALSIRQPRLIRELGRSAREKRQEELRAALGRSQSSDEYREIAESYAAENDRLRDDLKEKEDRLSMLERQMSELQLALRYVPQADSTELLPDQGDEISSVEQAVKLAKNRFSDRIVFSERIDEGIASLNEGAGPPCKIFNYLGVLHELAGARGKGALGVGVVDWLAQKGVVCSVESETVRNAGGRLFMVNGESVSFDYHLKPADGVSPDRCVRIYFDFIDGGRVRVGWVGRHPE